LFTKLSTARVSKIERVDALLLRFCLIISVCLAVAAAVAPQTHSGQRRSSRPVVKPQPEYQPTPPVTPEPSPEPTSEPTPVEEVQEAETLKINTNLVTVPVIATTIEGNYIPDLRQDEFSVLENGDKQEVAFFATVSAPFHVVLLLDTSASTREKLGSIQRAAIAFVEQLQSADRVKIISFDSEVHDLSDFTNDRALLRAAIYKTASGQGTKLYDAFALGLSSIKTISGRKAIVLFTDGVDWHSDDATYDSTLKRLDEEGVIVYPIRYETRAETERIAREASDDPSSSLPTIGVIRQPSGTTPTTFPSDNPSQVPTLGRPKTGPFGLPTADTIMRGRRRDSDNQRYPSPDGRPPTTGPTGQPGGHDPRDPLPDSRDDSGSWPSGGSSRRDGDTLDAMLDQLYFTADGYLTELANKTGGRLVRADTLASLPDAFAKIAAELRTQYMIGYYPSNKERDGQYRKIKVTTTRKHVAVRARPGYRAPRGG
jgi:uncharacterized protein YegL